VKPATVAALTDSLAGYDRVVEVGVGTRHEVAAALAARGADVTATDVVERDVPDAVQFVRDDVTDPDRAVYEGAGAVYALNLPPELHRPTREVARRAGAAFLFTTLGGDAPAVPAVPEQVPGDTIYRAHDGRAGSDADESRRRR